MRGERERERERETLWVVLISDYWVLRVYWVTKIWNHHLTGSAVVSI
jgi:hypothetical protein